MSTNDVPGANQRNGDELAMGCWAEHEDESLIFVESTEGGRVIYSIFDTSPDPPVEYRDAMPEAVFKRRFSWSEEANGASEEKWLWHDKTPFPWDRVIKAGATDGPRRPSAAAELNAAQRVAESLRLRAREVDAGNIAHRRQETVARIGALFDSLKEEIGRLAE